MSKNIILLSLLLLSSLGGIAQQTFRIVGYLPGYRWDIRNNVNFDYLTHICISFVNPDANGIFSFSHPVTSYVEHCHGKNVKVFASIGGGAESSTLKSRYKTWMAPDKRTELVKNLMNYIRNNKLDGVDVDLEGELVMDANYNAFVIQLADSLHAAGLGISAAVAAWTNSYISDAVSNKLDFINIMSYDQTGSWQPKNPGPHSTYQAAVNDFNYWLNTRAQPSDKIVLGLPFYGHEFKTDGTAGSIAWCQISNDYPDRRDFDDADTANGTIYYNGKETIRKKTQFVLDQRGGGVMIWELGQDCFNSEHSLFNVIVQTINKTLSVGILTDSASIKLYPNPAQNEVRIEGISEGNYQIYSLEGKLVQQGLLNGQRILLDALPAGVYGITLQLPGGVHHQKILKWTKN